MTTHSMGLPLRNEKYRVWKDQRTSSIFFKSFFVVLWGLSHSANVLNSWYEYRTPSIRVALVRMLVGGTLVGGYHPPGLRDSLLVVDFEQHACPNGR